MLHRAGEATSASQFTELLEYGEVEGNLSNAATWERHAAMARSGLHRDLAQTTRSSAATGERDIELVEIGGKLFGGGVLVPHLTDLATHADLDPSGLQLTNEGDRFGGAHRIDALLLLHRWQGEVNEC